VPHKDLTVAGLFAGVGGIERGFESAGFKTVFANELDPYAITTYSANRLQNSDEHFEVTPGDIVELALPENLGLIPKGFMVLTGGFPCQPFSVAGYRKGFNDDRGNVFWSIRDIARARKPDVIFLENVKNLVGHDSGNTYRVIRGALGNKPTDEAAPGLGYHVHDRVLNARDFGIPQNRERIYIVAFRTKRASDKFRWPEPIELRNELKDFIDFDAQVDPKYYYPKGSFLHSRLVGEITSTNRVYQWRRRYVRPNMSGVCPTLTANMGMGGHNVPLILDTDGRIRKLTPTECFRLMGFNPKRNDPKFDMKFPETMADSRLYKQAGNAVVVPVIAKIAEQIRLAVES